MPFRIPSHRLGVRIYTPAGFVLNGAIQEREHIEYLTKELGYRLKRCAGIPAWEPTEEELEEMAAADRQLGIHRGESGTTQMERDLGKGLRDIFAPVRKVLRRTFLANGRL